IKTISRYLGGLDVKRNGNRVQIFNLLHAISFYTGHPYAKPFEMQIDKSAFFVEGVGFSDKSNEDLALSLKEDLVFALFDSARKALQHYYGPKLRVGFSI
ncbi:MAG: hypothetical protein ABIH22_00585, partial [Candidatus Margulisiibacteriota bacterium]